MIFDQTQIRFLQVEPVIVSKDDRKFLRRIPHDKAMQSDMREFAVSVLQKGLKHNFGLIQKRLDQSPSILADGRQHFIIQFDRRSLLNFKFYQIPAQTLMIGSYITALSKI